MEPPPPEPADRPELPAEPADQPPGDSVEIHPPHAPIQSVRDFFIQLLTITAGVLIALSLEGVLEWNHYRTLVREAMATINREIADNKREVDGVLANSTSRTKDLDTALQLANDLLATKTSDIRELRLGFMLADLSTASWRSAQSTGALGHMDYAEVRKYSDVYGQQERYAAQQQRTLERMSAALAIFAQGRHPHQAPLEDIQMFRQHLLALSADVLIEQQLGRSLSERYQRVLQPSPDQKANGEDQK